MFTSITDMYLFEQYRPPGRSNRSGRAHADNDVFEGLPVKQWNRQQAHISLAPPKSDDPEKQNDKWAEPPMPRDYQLLQPWTQHLLRLARSGKVGTKRKPDPDSLDEDKPEDEQGEDAKANFNDDRGYVAKKWKPVPETMLEPEHRHFEFLAKRRKGLPSLYAPEQTDVAPVPMRKTKVKRAGLEGEVAIYEVLVPEGQIVEGEVTADNAELAEIKPIAATAGTVIEGLGIANDEGVIVAEHLKPSAAPRRNRPPPKKKGGPGRGKKRVTFTNPDGSTYTTVVPNATKIVPQPGQTVKHVAKGEEATADVSAPQAPTRPGSQEKQEGEGEGSEEDGDDDGDDDEDREDGEVSDEEGADTNADPAPPQGEEKGADDTSAAPAANDDAVKTEDTVMEDADASQPPPATTEEDAAAADTSKPGEASNSPEKPPHSKQGSVAAPAAAEEAEAGEPEPVEALSQAAEGEAPAAEEAAAEPAPAPEAGKEGEAEGGLAEPEPQKFEDGEEDLLGSLEKSLGAEGEKKGDAAAE